MHIKDAEGQSIAAILGEGTEVDGLLFAAAPDMRWYIERVNAFLAILPAGNDEAYALSREADELLAKAEGR